jgi:hypothetical protein
MKIKSLMTGLVGATALVLSGQTNATLLSLSDDSFTNVGLGFTFNFFGVNYNSMYVNSNGSISFGSGDKDFSESVSEFLGSPPRIGGVWDDLNPQQAGTIDATGDANEMIVSWNGVPEFFNTGSNTFSITIRNDHSITIDFQSMTLSDGIVGISNGLSQPDPGETDFSAGTGNYAYTSTPRYERFSGGTDSFDLARRQLNFVVPAPLTLTLMGIGLVCFGALGRRKGSRPLG